MSLNHPEVRSCNLSFDANFHQLIPVSTNPITSNSYFIKSFRMRSSLRLFLYILKLFMFLTPILRVPEGLREKGSPKGMDNLSCCCFFFSASALQNLQNFDVPYPFALYKLSVVDNPRALTPLTMAADPRGISRFRTTRRGLFRPFWSIGGGLISKLC